jgi:hypothetical protein
MAQLAQQQRTERRKHQRLPMDASVGLAVLSGPLTFLVRRPQFQASVRNASVSGFQLRVERSIPEDAAVKLWIQVKNGGQPKTLGLVGDVVWSKPEGQDGAFLVGIRLRSRPEESMRIWAHTMFQEIRFRAGPL